MPHEQEERERLEGAAESRELRRRRDHLERYLAHLRIAQHHFAEATNPRSPSPLDEALAQGHSTLDGLNQRLGGHIHGRRRPKRRTTEDQDEVLMFVDECGSPRLSASADSFGAFALGAVLVRRESYREFEETWSKWKRSVWGTDSKKIHEPDVRVGHGPFWFEGNRSRRRRALDSLHETIRQLDFKSVVVVIRRQAYVDQYGHGGINDILPEAPYPMALDFLSERLVFALDQEFAGAKGRLIAESRGPLEDAQLQREFARLQIDGTTYISASWFRHQLDPGIRFGTKNERIAGLEVADLLCRPYAEKALAPTSSPARWPEFREKLCLGRETAHSPVGIKVVPWSDEHEGFWKS